VVEMQKRSMYSGREKRLVTGHTKAPTRVISL